MYMYIWEFQVIPGSETEFERIYGATGDWVQLFKQGQGYIKTELHRDTNKKGRYLTIDYWVSKKACETFREQFNCEFEALDKHCESLTEREIQIGEFLSVTK